MPEYRIPSVERIRESLARVFATRHEVESQHRLKLLVEKDLRGEERFRVGETRLRQIALDSGLIHLEIHTRETEQMRSLIKCPVCGERLKRVRNMSVYGGTVTLGYKCGRCGYWTGLRRRIPIRYVFTRRL